MFAPLQSGIAHYAHLVGLSTGIIYGVYLLKKKKESQKNFQRPKVTVVNPKGDRYSDSIQMTKDELKDYLNHGRL